METKIFHYRTPLAQQTIACAIENNKVFKFAIAECHPKDQFCKHTGRVKALGRLKSDRCSSYLDEEISFEDFRKEYFDHGPIFPGRS
jgi:hypothetical protein